MYTAIEYRYRDVPVEIHGTNDETALIEINAILIAVPIGNLEIDYGKGRHTSEETEKDQEKSR